VRQVAGALAYAHRVGFVHRDIKPGNILLAGDRVLLADFGIARAIDVLTNEKLTESGVALGTATYMSPEQAAGERVDGRSDLYSLACVLFEMLLGTPPFIGHDSHSVRARHAVDPVPSIRTVRGTVPPSLERVITTAMAKSPADRYPSAGALMAALDAVDLTDTAPTVAGAGAQRHRAAERRWIAAIGGILLIGGLAGAAWWWRGSRPTPLEAGRVMVFPLATAADAGGRGTGEDIATLIGNALDGAGELRWIDGWTLLGAATRDDARRLGAEEARRLATSRRCAWYLTGRLLVRGDSAEVLVDLTDVRGDSVVARGRARGPADNDWRLGLQAVNQVLPALIPNSTPDLQAEWTGRDPAAVASYLRGEAAFRRLQLGSALARYQDAVRADTGFALAAIRGAQAATWNHRPSEAAALIGRAVRLPLSARYRHFALGYEAYLQGRPDSAEVELRRALAADPELTAAWVQLGELYTHLLPVAGRVDSLAEDAFETARRLDPRAANQLLHLIQLRLRRGDTAEAAPLVSAFLAATPDTSRLSHEVRVMGDCVRRGPDRIEWAEETAHDRSAVLVASKELGVGGAQLACALPGLAAVMAGDTSRVGDDRWYARLLLQALLLAQQRTREALALLRAAPPADEARLLLLMDAPVHPAVRAESKVVADSLERACGAGFRQCGNPSLLWKLALWEADAGRTTQADVLAAELARQAADSVNSPPSERRVARIRAGSAAAHATLARGDTVAAMAQLRAVLLEPVPNGLELDWDVARPRGLDRLVLARLLLATGDARGALETASVLDSPSPAVFSLYIPAGLELRARAADALGDVNLASRFRERLKRLEGSGVAVADLSP
jgi:hypothetical protein